MKLIIIHEQGTLDLTYSPLVEVFVDMIWVEPDHRRRGIARYLMWEALALTRGLGLSIRLEAPTELEAFYQSLGFVKDQGGLWCAN